MYVQFGKRVLDVSIALWFTVLLSPLFALLSLLIKLTLGPPVFFRQRRAGLHGQPFTLLKFRTMLDLYDAQGRPLADEDRLTRFGQFLRKLSLDELPTLVNVLKGDMSLLGPRPLLLRYVDRYSASQRRRLEVKPGVTGWAQVHGRNALSWDEKFELDVWYVENQSLWLDMKILALTILKVVKREGISQPGHATMEEFWGSTREKARECVKQG